MSENKEQFEDYYLEGLEVEAYEKIAEEVEKYNAEWMAKWPNHCKSCGGWGMFFIPGKLSGPPETCYPDSSDPCENLPDDVCHRCGGLLVENTDITPNGYQLDPKCSKCGWSFDDGIRSY